MHKLRFVGDAKLRMASPSQPSYVGNSHPVQPLLTPIIGIMQRHVYFTAEVRNCAVIP